MECILNTRTLDWVAAGRRAAGHAVDAGPGFDPGRPWTGAVNERPKRRWTLTS